MANFLLASQRLIRIGQEKKPYEYFETYLVTVHRSQFSLDRARGDGILR